MAGNDLARRFTEENYATKSEVSRELKMSLIDNIWSNILKYRAQFYHYLTLKSIDKNQLMICYCQSVQTNINSTESKILNALGEYVKIDDANGDLNHFEDMCYISILRQIANKHDIDISDIYLRSLIQGDLRDLPPEQKILKRYLESLRFIRNKYNHEIDIDFLADLYSVFTDNPELTKFYREKEDLNPNNRVLIDRIYSSAPPYLIDGLMNSLFSFISTSSSTALVKSIVTLYFINYVKPFPDGNEEIALLMMKAVFAHYSLSDFGTLIPFENLLNLNEDVVNRICNEVQRTNDLTYFINQILKGMDASLEDLADIKANYTSDIVRKDFYREDVVEVKEEEPVYEEAVPEEVVYDAQNEEPIMDDEPIVKQEQPVESPAPTAPAPSTNNDVSHELAFSHVPEVLDEKAATRLEQYLLEMDPALKKGEAYFYARHCTMHMNYTIAQYKKALGCAYETARTSMDHLYELHYYQKQQIKNKFFYTPIKR